MTNRVYKNKNYIYYTKLFNMDFRLVDERLSFSPNSYHALKSRYGEEYVECKRMDMRTGLWDDFPISED